jgi:hypothetical protein
MSAKKPSNHGLPKFQNWGMGIICVAVIFPGAGMLVRALAQPPSEMTRGIVMALMVGMIMLAIPGFTMFIVGSKPKDMCVTKWNFTSHLLFGTWVVLAISSFLVGYSKTGLWFLPGHIIICAVSALLFIPVFACRKYYLQHPDG